MNVLMLIVLFLLVVLLFLVIIYFPEESKPKPKKEELDVFERIERIQFRCSHRDRRQYKDYEICVDCHKKFDY